MSNYKTNLILFINRFILIVAVYQICRILFYCVNLELFNNLSIRVFSGGLLFDLAAVAYINIPFLIAHLFPGNFKYSPKYQKILLVSFYAVNLAFIATNFIDIIYYRFTGRRSTYAMITADGMEHDVIRLIPSFLKEFWYIAILFIITGFVLWKLLPKAKSPITPKELNRRDYVQKAIYTVISIFVVLLMIRGGVQKKPIKIVDGMRYGNLNTSALVLNTPFTILKTAFKKKELEKTLKTKAVLDAKANAQILAEAAGQKIGKAIVLSETPQQIIFGVQPMMRNAMYKGAMAEAADAAGENGLDLNIRPMKVTSEISASFELL